MEHVVDSCFFQDNKIWNIMICFYIFLEEIELSTSKVMQMIKLHSIEMNSRHSIHKNVMTSRIDEEIVGFKTKAKAIIDQLTSGIEKIHYKKISSYQWTLPTVHFTTAKHRQDTDGNLYVVIFSQF